MKVLWFTNKLLVPVCTYLGNSSAKGGGWMDALISNLEIEVPGIDLHIASLSKRYFSPVKIGNTTYYSIVQDVPSIRIKRVFSNWKHNRFFDNELQQCNALIFSCKPDIIHVHGSENLFGLVQEKTNIPVVISLQGILQSYQYFDFSGISFLERIRTENIFAFLKGSSLTHRSITNRKQALIEQRILANCSHIFGRTYWDKSIATLLCPKASYHSVGEILREPFYHTHWDADSLEQQIIVATASGGLRKGVIVLLDAIRILKHGKYPGIKLRLIGNIKTQAIWPLISEKIKNYGIENNIKFLGELDATSIAHELSKCSVFVHPSFIDNSPNSLAEAMLIGVPSVATSVGGVPSMLSHNQDGLLCTPGDPYSIASQLNILLADKSKATKISLCAREKAMKRHSKQMIIEHLINNYNKIIDVSAKEIL